MLNYGRFAHTSIVNNTVAGLGSPGSMGVDLIYRRAGLRPLISFNAIFVACIRISIHTSACPLLW